jgi:hypothetical protein
VISNTKLRFWAIQPRSFGNYPAAPSGTLSLPMKIAGRRNRPLCRDAPCRQGRARPNWSARRGHAIRFCHRTCHDFLFRTGRRRRRAHAQIQNNAGRQRLRTMLIYRPRPRSSPVRRAWPKFEPFRPGGLYWSCPWLHGPSAGIRLRAFGGLGISPREPSRSAATRVNALRFPPIGRMWTSGGLPCPSIVHHTRQRIVIAVPGF